MELEWRERTWSEASRVSLANGRLGGNIENNEGEI